MNNFVTRMLINVVGIPAILFLIYLGGLPFLGLIIAISVIAQYEFYQIAKAKGTKPYTKISIIFGVTWLLCAYLLPTYLDFFFFLIIILFLLFSLYKGIVGATLNISASVMGFAYVPLLLSALVLLRGLSNQFLISEIEVKRITFLTFASIWICDSLAFVFGKWLKGPKIAPIISPNKTISGCIAGLIGAVATTILFKLIGWAPEMLNLTGLIIFGVLIGIFGQSGDFVESVFKRDAEVKDSGHLLLGHGGVLDRFDSFFVSAPVIYLFIVFYIKFRKNFH